MAFDSLPEPKTSPPTMNCIDLIHAQYAHPPRVNIRCESGGLTIGRHTWAKDPVEERTARVQSKLAVDVAIQVTPKVPQQPVPELVDFNHLPRSLWDLEHHLLEHRQAGIQSEIRFVGNQPLLAMARGSRSCIYPAGWALHRQACRDERAGKPNFIALRRQRRATRLQK